VILPKRTLTSAQIPKMPHPQSPGKCYLVEEEEEMHDVGQSIGARHTEFMSLTSALKPRDESPPTPLAEENEILMV